MSLTGVPQPLHVQAGAKQREQTSAQTPPAPGHEAKFRTSFEFGKMPEDNDAEQRAAEYKTEATQKKKCVTEDRARLSKRDRNQAHAAPERDLHQQ